MPKSQRQGLRGQFARVVACEYVGLGSNYAERWISNLAMLTNDMREGTRVGTARHGTPQQTGAAATVAVSRIIPSIIGQQK